MVTEFEVGIFASKQAEMIHTHLLVTNMPNSWHNRKKMIYDTWWHISDGDCVATFPMIVIEREIVTSII